MIENSPISILGTDSISVCDFGQPKRSYGIRMETRDSFDESDSWQMRIRKNQTFRTIRLRREPVECINRGTMMQLLTRSGAQTLRAQTTLADNKVSNIMPTNGNFPGGNNYDSTNRNKEKNKPIM